MCVIWWRSSQVLSSPAHATDDRLETPLVFRLAEVVEAFFDQQVQRERQAGQPVGENAVVDIAATGKVAGQRRGRSHISRPQRAYW